MPLQQGMGQMTPAVINTIRRGVKSTARGAVRRASSRRRKGKSAAKSTRKRSGGTSGRKIKFGSPAWRKKYKLGKKKR